MEKGLMKREAPIEKGSLGGVIEKFPAECGWEDHAKSDLVLLKLRQACEYICEGVRTFCLSRFEQRSHASHGIKSAKSSDLYGVRSTDGSCSFYFVF